MANKIKIVLKSTLDMQIVGQPRFKKVDHAFFELTGNLPCVIDIICNVLVSIPPMLPVVTF